VMRPLAVLLAAALASAACGKYGPPVRTAEPRPAPAPAAAPAAPETQPSQDPNAPAPGATP
jgi:hypothetical protein